MSNKISNFKKTFIIAEIGLNHNGDFNLATESIKVAAKAGADAVKFQNFLTEDFLTDKKILHTYKSGDREITEPLFDICKRCEFKTEWFPELTKICEELGIEFISTPTSEKGVDDLVSYGVKYIKNGSDYLSHIPLLKYMALTDSIILISIGMAYEEEIDDAIDAILSVRPDKSKIIILLCTSSYPTSPQNVNLNKLMKLKDRYKISVGFSDHTEGWESAVQAVTLGAKVIEKHFTLDKKLPGPDHWFSSNFDEFKKLVTNIRLAEIRMGEKDLKPANSEIIVREQWRLGLVWKKNIKINTKISIEDIAIRKPSTGLRPKDIYSIVGNRAVKNCEKGKPVVISDFKK